MRYPAAVPASTSALLSPAGSVIRAPLALAAFRRADRPAEPAGARSRSGRAHGLVARRTESDIDQVGPRACDHEMLQPLAGRPDGSPVGVHGCRRVSRRRRWRPSVRAVARASASWAWARGGGASLLCGPNGARRGSPRRPREDLRPVDQHVDRAALTGGGRLAAPQRTLVARLQRLEPAEAPQAVAMVRGHGALHGTAEQQVGAPDRIHAPIIRAEPRATHRARPTIAPGRRGSASRGPVG
jgi:hypothetical protein